LNGGKQEELRLLPKPLYRYELKGVKDADPSLQDGAMFAFVMGTDPEVILLLEVMGRDDKVTWKYAFARATGTVANASLGSAVVWSEGSETASRNPTNTQLTIQRPLPQ